MEDRTVVIESLALLKIINHCESAGADSLTGCGPSVGGCLLGIEVDSENENSCVVVSNAFGFPGKAQSGPSAAAGGSKGGLGDSSGTSVGVGSASNAVDADEAMVEEMLKMLKTVNADANVVGCYQSMYMGTFAPSLLSASHPLVLLYDPVQASSSHLGNVVVRCFKLRSASAGADPSPDAAQAAQGGGGSGGNVNEPIYDEWTVKVQSCGLVRAALYDLNRNNRTSAPRPTPLTNSQFGPSGDVDFDRLDLSTNPYLEKNLEHLSNWVGELVREQEKYSSFARNLLKEEYTTLPPKRNAKKIYVDKKARWLDGPSRLDGLLTGVQIGVYCDNVLGAGNRAIRKTWVMGAIAGNK